MAENMHAGARSSDRKLVIAIDGPAGSGKSTLAALLARRYNYTNIETGAMYRALSYKAIENGVSLDDEKKLAALAERSRIELVPDPDGNRVQTSVTPSGGITTTVNMLVDTVGCASCGGALS